MTEAGEEFIDRSAHIAPKQVKTYLGNANVGRLEFNNGSILVKSKHPLDECLRRGIIEQEHHDNGKRIMTVRDCALPGQRYTGRGEGDGDVDAGTLYLRVWRAMPRKQWRLIEIVCFVEPDVNGGYFTEAEYAQLYALAPNIKHAFETLDTTVAEARKAIQEAIKAAAKQNV